MPTYVNPEPCNACQGVHQGPLCVYICPNDLMVLEPNSQEGFNQEPEMCSECYACVRLCPQEAIHVRGYADFVPLGAEANPATCRAISNGTLLFGTDGLSSSPFRWAPHHRALPMPIMVCPSPT